MAEKKRSASATPRKTTRSAKSKTNNAIANVEQDERLASETVSTADYTTGTSRNAVIEGASSIDTDEVRRRAYELYEERGGEHGLHEDDWYRAEQEVRARNRNQQKPQQKKSA
jgi:Protein of unknown function (DUF2934)